MKGKYKFLYFISSFAIYCLLSFLEFFFFDDLLNIVSTRYIVHFAVFVVCLLTVNPLVTYFFVDMLPFKPKLRLKGNINEDLKGEM